MRRIDGVIGNLACAALAGAKRIARPFARTRPEVKNIVVMKFFGLGSIVVASPALAALRDQFPTATIHFVTFESNRGVLELLDLTDHNHYVDPATPASFARTTLGVIRALRAARCDLAINLESFAKFPHALAGLAGIPQHAGFYLESERWRRTLLDVPGTYNHYFHTKDIFLSLPYLIATRDPYFLHFAEFSARFGYPRMTPSRPERAALRRKLGPRVAAGDQIIVLNPNTSNVLAPGARKWPEDRYAALAGRLLRQLPRARVVCIGADDERAYVERIAGLAGSPRVFSTAGELSLRELLTLFAEASLVVSNDSGPMHLACLVDAPLVGLFFGESPTLFAPLGSRVRVVAPALYSIPLYTVYNGKDVNLGRPAGEITNAVARSVSVEQVMAEVRSLLATGSSEAVLALATP